MGKTKIFAISNQKGGVGKTTTSINISAGFGMHKKKVLLVDLDPQGNATAGIGVIREKLEYDVSHVFRKEVDIRKVIIKGAFTNVDLLPATVRLAGVDLWLIQDKKQEDNVLKDALAPIIASNEYDYIIFDCPPSLGILNRNALATATGVIIPVQAEHYALDGVNLLIQNVRLIKLLHNPNLKIEGVLLTMFESKFRLHVEMMKDVKKNFTDKVYNNYIPRNIKLAEAPSMKVPIFNYDRKCKGATAYWKLVKEIIDNNE